ncbi:hypothetical protein CEXT_733631 [Caerostris extrusa]|uniref:Uncharacterized protein n=1 Tax=Caerostris extrusa TaxID=172846 RepID=A0AAV4U1I1_CAEEX|nr:hypothetical protein CEXT_733631 [Caerostris extrusa]
MAMRHQINVFCFISSPRNGYREMNLKHGRGENFAFYEKSFVFSFCTSPDVKANHNQLIFPMIDGTWNDAWETDYFMGGKNGMNKIKLEDTCKKEKKQPCILF